MKIAFTKLNSSKHLFHFEFEGVVFEGSLVKKTKDLVEAKFSMKGGILKECDRCGKEFTLKIDEENILLMSDGIFKDEENHLSDVMEFFDSHIDLLEFARSELGNYLSDYFYCPACKD